MKKLLILLTITTLTLTATASDVSLSWVNGANQTATVAWQTIVYASTTPNAGPTNYVSTTIVQWPATNVTVINLQAGRRYYFTAVHNDMEELSVPSNEVMAKTKISNPKSLSIIP